MQIMHLTGAPPYYTNCFLVISNAKNVAVIDPAAPAAAVNAALKEQGATLTHILLTHGHFDHVTSLEELRGQWGAKLCMFQQDACGGRMRPPPRPTSALPTGTNCGWTS